jgi:hypothetical protein
MNVEWNFYNSIHYMYQGKKEVSKLMLQGRRSQAALEFLMTYGWAILVVLIVISALAYFGVLNPQALVPAKCTLTTGLSCKDYQVSAGSQTIRLKIANGMGTGILINNISVVPTSGNTATPLKNFTFLPTGESYGTQLNVRHIDNGGESEFAITCGAGTAGICGAAGSSIPTAVVNPNNKYRWNIVIQYWADGSDINYAKWVQGELFAPVGP